MIAVVETALILKVIIAIATLLVTIFGLYKAYWSPEALRKKKIQKLEDELGELADEMQKIRLAQPFDEIRYHTLGNKRKQLRRMLESLRRSEVYK
jgi:hypothetical protein